MIIDGLVFVAEAHFCHPERSEGSRNVEIFRFAQTDNEPTACFRNRNNWRFLLVCAVALTVFFVGCGGNGLKEISGTITCDGQPLKKGIIMLLPPDGKGPTAAAIITNGTYSTKAAIGPKQVKIEGYEIKGLRRYPRSMLMCEDRKQILSERYNAKTELTRNITSDVRTYDFTLQK